MKTLIVDDSALIRDRLVEVLSSIPGLEIIGLEGEANKAVVAIRLEKPDLVILDIRLIGGSGIDVLREIKQDNPDLKVIIFTGYPYPQYRRKCLKEGADVFLDKSNGFEHIKPIIQRFGSEAKRKGSRDEV